MSRVAVFLLMSVALGCQRESAAVEDDGAPPACQPHELSGTGGRCYAVGVPPAACPEGFEPDGLAGCAAVLPAAPCSPGTMALAGEAACHDVVSCPDAPYGVAPIDASTQHVNAGYSGGSSDGSAQRPWTRIDDAIAAATPGAVIAVAAGSYVGDITIEGKPVRIWGRCPKLVEVVGSATFAAVSVNAGATATELRHIAVRGAANGMFISGSLEVIVDGVWVHDLTGRGINAQDSYGPTSAHVSGSLVENVVSSGVYFGGCAGTIVGSVIRDVESQPNGRAGSAAAAEEDPMTGARSVAEITNCVFERLHDAGINVGSSDLKLERTLVRDVLPAPDQLFGMGMSAHQAAAGGTNVEVRASVFERSHYLGVLAYSSHATLEHVTIRDITPRPGDQTFGDGVAAVAEVGPASLVVRASSIARAARAGIDNFGGSLELVTTSVLCSAFALNAETVNSTAPVFVDGGGNVCGCDGALGECKVVSSNLEPPTPPP